MKIILLILASLLIVNCYANNVEKISNLHFNGWKLMNKADLKSNLHITIGVKQNNLDVLESTLLRVSDPNNKDYGKWWTMERINNLVENKVGKEIIIEYLLNNGININQITTDIINFVHVDLSVEQAEDIFKGDFYIFKHDLSDDAIIRSNVPFVVDNVDVLNNIDIVSGIRFPRILKKNIRIAPKPKQFSSVTPKFLRDLYNITNHQPANVEGNTQAVAQFLGQFYSPQDLKQFLQEYAPNVQNEWNQVKVQGPNSPNNPGAEASLDIQYIMGVSQSNISNYFDSTPGLHDGQEPFLKWLADLNKRSVIPNVISISYGDDEPTLSVTYIQRVSTEFQKLGLRGITLLAASGDSGVAGSEGCKNGALIPEFPASSPYITAVGGSTSSQPEVVNGLSGGGFSNVFPQPSYQTRPVKQYFASGTNLPSESYNRTMAGFPDVSAQSADFVITLGQFDTLVSGTSAACPTFAGVMGLLNSVRISQGKPVLGYANPWLYNAKNAMNDITSGANYGCGFSENGFEATQGWDPVTGLGTPNFEKMVGYL